MAKKTKSINKSSTEEAIIPFGTKGRFIEDSKELEKIVNALRTIGAKIVLTQGAFDFIHIGHFLYLEKARRLGDILIVGVDDDKKVTSRKGPERPIVSQNERVKMLTHVRHVDIVTLKSHDDPKWKLIKLIKPDVLVATKETYTAKQIRELKKYCKRVEVMEPQATTSTTAKLRRLNIGLSRKMQEAITRSINDTFEKLLKNA